MVDINHPIRFRMLNIHPPSASRINGPGKYGNNGVERDEIGNTKHVSRTKGLFVKRIRALRQEDGEISSVSSGYGLEDQI